MRLPAFIACSILIAGFPGAAEAQSIVEVCQRAVALYLNVPELEGSNVHALPESQPPRVRITARYVVKLDAVAATVRRLTGQPTTLDAETPFVCSFVQAVKPFGLTKLCHSDSLGCIDKERLEELQVLLSREGYSEHASQAFGSR